MRLLFLKKPHSAAAKRAWIDGISLVKSLGIAATVVVEPQDLPELASSLGRAAPALSVYQPSEGQDIDYAVTFGGDGTVLHASSLFPQRCPPVLAFGLGTLSFVPPFGAKDIIPAFQATFIDKTSTLSYRSRLQCSISGRAGDSSLKGSSTVVLNEVAVLGASASPAEASTGKLVYTVNGKDATAAGDVIVSTPTGSTGYNFSAGGAAVHPDLPAVIVFNPDAKVPTNLFSKGSVLNIKSASDCACVVEGDGQLIDEALAPGESIEISEAKYPLPLVAQSESSCEPFHWLQDLHHTMNWNKGHVSRYVVTE